jgi:hypothetical protein
LKIFTFVETPAMNISEIQLYELLASKLGRPEAQGLVEFVETKVANKMDEKINTLAIKQDITFLKQEMYNVKMEMSSTKVDLIKWMIGTGIALAGVMAALMVGMIQYIGH